MELLGSKSMHISNVDSSNGQLFNGYKSSVMQDG